MNEQAAATEIVRDTLERMRSATTDARKIRSIDIVLAHLGRDLDENPAVSASRERGGRWAFDWHRGTITRATPITTSYRSTQKVRRFFEAECGDEFRFDRAFMAWLKAAIGRTMGEAVDEWHRRQALKR